MPSPDTNPALADAQFRKLTLEIEKLQIDVANSQRVQWIDLFFRFIPLVTILIALFTFLFTVSKYRQEQVDNRASLAKDKETAAKQAQLAFMAPILQKQQELYFEASTAAATVASADDPQSRAEAEETFWRLYYGPMVFVENKEVSGGMVEFGDCLNRRPACADRELKTLSLKLSNALEIARRKTWKMTPEEYMNDQFAYR